MLESILTQRWRGATKALQGRSLAVSLGLHIGVAGALYGLGYGAWESHHSQDLTISLQQPEPTPCIEEIPEPEPDEPTEVEEEMAIELDRPVIEDPTQEPLPEPEYVIEEAATVKEIAESEWLKRIITPKPAEVVEARHTQPEQKPQLPTIEPKPLVGKNSPPTYPRTAVRNRWEGTALLEVKVDDEGDVQACRILQSSGYKILDDAAIRAVKNWAFDSGPGTAQVPIVFSLRSH